MRISEANLSTFEDVADEWKRIELDVKQYNNQSINQSINQSNKQSINSTWKKDFQMCLIKH